MFPFALITVCTVWQLEFKPARLLSQHDLTVFYKASLSQNPRFCQYSTAPINVQCSWSQVTVEDSPWQLWGVPSCSRNPSPQKSNWRVEHVSKDGVVLLLVQNSPRLKCSHQHVSRWGWNTEVSFSLPSLSNTHPSVTYTKLSLGFISKWDTIQSSQD